MSHHRSRGRILAVSGNVVEVDWGEEAAESEDLERDPSTSRAYLNARADHPAANRRTEDDHHE